MLVASPGLSQSRAQFKHNEMQIKYAHFWWEALLQWVKPIEARRAMLCDIKKLLKPLKLYSVLHFCFVTWRRCNMLPLVKIWWSNGRYLYLFQPCERLIRVVLIMWTYVVCICFEGKIYFRKTKICHRQSIINPDWWDCTLKMVELTIKYYCNCQI